MEVGKYFLSMKTKAAHNLSFLPALPSPACLLLYSFPKLALFLVFLLGRDKQSTLLIHKSQPHSETLMKGWLNVLQTRFQNIRIFLNAIKNLNRFPKANPE